MKNQYGENEGWLGAVISIKVRIKSYSGSVMGIAEVETSRELDAVELGRLKELLRGQYYDGWGHSLEQTGVYVDEAFIIQYLGLKVS